MVVAVVGGSGYIGGALLERLKAADTVERVLRVGITPEDDAYLDLCQADRFDYSLLDGVDFVVFMAAVSGPDQCAAEYERCWEINVTGTVKFIEEAAARGCDTLFFSSDAAFGDIPGAVYTELSETRADTPYGRMKKAVEDHFKESPHFKAIRLSYVVSARDRFTSYCLNCVKTGETAEVFHPFYRNCISLGNVIHVVLWMLENWAAYRPWVLNVAGPELVSRVRIADELNRLLPRKLTYTVRLPDEAFYRNRPPITQMKSLYLEEYGILTDGTFTELLKHEMEGVEYGS